MPKPSIDLEGTDLSKVLVRQYDYPHTHPKVFSGETFFTHLNKGTGTHLWIMSYTVSRDHYVHIPITRIICEIGGHRLRDDPKCVVRLTKTHIKLYLQLIKDKVVAVYTGSQNLVAPTNLNLMVELPKNQNEYFTQFFNHYWSRSSALS